MEYDYRKISCGALTRTNDLSERAILWGMIAMVLVIAAGMIKGMVG
jgi:hypothetical protein